jgi:hypothetical protein
VEQLNSLQSAINQPRHAVEKSKTQEGTCKERRKAGIREREETAALAELPPALFGSQAQRRRLGSEGVA